MSARKDTETNPNSNEIKENGDHLEWISHPATANSKRTAWVIAFLLIVFLAVYLTTKSELLTIVAVFIMVGSLSSFFMPTKYRMDSKGIYIKTPGGKRNYNWGRFRSFYPDKNGVLLSPFKKPSRLENFRGVYIRFTDNRDEVVRFIEKMISKYDNPEGGENVSI